MENTNVVFVFFCVVCLEYCARKSFSRPWRTIPGGTFKTQQSDSWCLDYWLPSTISKWR